MANVRLAGIIVAAALLAAAAPAPAQELVVGQPQPVGQPTQPQSASPIPGLDYNYYYGGGQLPARLYLCPRPVPERVGYTYITYQPFAPHEFLYRHSRTYTRRHWDGGVTVTRVTWW